VEFVASAKFILAGEHAVLRGSGALVFPLSCYQVKLDYKETGLKFSSAICQDESMRIIFHGALAKALAFVGKPQDFLSGSITLESNIPMGVGLGFSAALSSVIAKLLVALDVLDTRDFFACARHIEGYFHGVSSGVDIAGANSNVGVYFAPNGRCEELYLAWDPKLFLQLSGGIGITSAGVSLVQKMHQENPELALKIDRDMSASVLLARRALLDSALGFDMLKEAINMASSCFKRWDLMPENAINTAASMQENGAVATKCTGSGGGGAVLGLWIDDPSNKDRIIKAL
jgi:mevalonate kinase